MALKDLLAGKLTKRELELAPSGFDLLGSRERAVAIVELDKRLTKKKKIVAAAIMKLHKNVRTVLLKGGPRAGTYRNRKMTIIAGSRNTKIIHKESGCRFLVDPRRVYFSPREAAERLRIVEKVHDGETVMVFFAGVGPFAILVAKKASHVYGIEINPAAVAMFRENVKLNKCTNVDAVKGDVKKVAKKYYGLCDRVVMPLPESAINFLSEAASCLKKHGIIHLYCFCAEEDIKKKRQEIKKLLPKNYSIVGQQFVLPYGPHIWKMRFDVENTGNK